MASETSEATSWSQVSTTTSDPDKARIFITLSNGVRILVPIAQDATIHDLHQQALRRAVRFGFQWNLRDSFLQTISDHPTVMDGEDKLLDVLDLTQDNTFKLCSLVEGSSTTLSGVLPHNQSASGLNDVLVYVRWVTLDDAISQPQLSHIPPENLPVSQNMPLKQLMEMAEARLNALPGLTGQKLNLYLKDCELNAKDNPASLQDLGLTGTLTDPLTIFIDAYTSEPETLNALKSNTDFYNPWGFDTTKRGICTFTTSLKMLCAEIDTGKLPLEDVLSAIFEVTHFPPLLLAFKQILEMGVESLGNASNLRLLASCMQVLCLQIAPIWICKTPETALESSRQLMAWLFTVGTKFDPQDKPVANVVKITEKQEQSPMTLPQCPELHEVSIEATTPSGPNATKRLVVGLAQQDSDFATYLARCIHKGFSDRWDFYLSYGDWQKMLAHKKLATPQPTEFDLLLKTTALAGRFRMVGPPQLGALLGAELPVVTLDGEGLVSVYGQEDYACGERSYYVWNAINKKQVMKSANPGQVLMQKLEPVIAQRKKEQSWDVDSWHEWNQTADFGTPEEAVVVCMDASGSMATSMAAGWVSSGGVGASPSRMTEVKEFFKNFALRVSALRLPTYLGLVTFSSKTQVTVKQDLTPVHLNFEDRVEGIEALSSTAMYDGLEKARMMLAELRIKHPKVKGRIIILTDGGDNASSHKPEDVGRRLVTDDIVLDSVVIGTELTTSLFKISKMTGGYAFAPKTQQAFFQIFLLETVVDFRTRPDLVKTPLTSWETYLPKSADMSDPYSFPPCRPHPNQNDYFIALADADRFLSRQARSVNSRTGTMSVRSMSTRSTSTGMTGTTLSSGGAGGSARIVLNEIKEMINHPHEYMDVYVSESNMGFWKVAMQGPQDSAYSAGTFLLYIDIGPEFPLKPPSARFITPVLHPNITKHGRICHPIFDREWTGTTRVYQVLQHIWGILMSLEARDAVDPLSTLKFWTDPVQGRKEVEQYVTRFASQTREAIRTDIVGSDTSSTSSRSSHSWDNISVTSAQTVTGSPRSQAHQRAVSRAASHISGFLASQRAPPPLMNMPGQTAQSANSAPSARNRSNGDSEAGGRRLSRRASFFSMFKKE